MRNMVFILSYLFSACAIFSQSFIQFEEPPKDVSISAGFQNDSFGLLPGVEWDDNESYVFRSRVSFPSGLFTSGSLHSFTARTETPDTGSRIDQFRAGGGFQMDTLGLGILKFDSAFYFGLSVMGNLGLGTLQSTWHESAGVCRAIPETYDPTLLLNPEATAIVRLNLDARVSPFAALELRTAFWDISAGTFVGLQFEGLRASIGGMFRHGDSGNPAYERVQEKETGLVFSTVCDAGALSYEMELWPASGICNASVSLSIGNEVPPSDFGLDLGLLMGSCFSSSVQIYRKLPGDGPLSILLCTGASSGWVDAEAHGTEASRAFQYRAGLALETMDILKIMRGRIGVHGYTGIEELRTLTMEESDVLDSRIQIGAGVSGEIRIFAFPFLPGLSGIGIRAWYFPFRHFVVDSVIDFRGRPPALLEVFIFSGRL